MVINSKNMCVGLTGYIEDGPDVDIFGTAPTIGVDIDYQRESSAMTVKFSGFESKLYGILSHEWAVGTSPREEDVQPFTSAGIVLRETDAIHGGGIYSISVFVCTCRPIYVVI